MIGIIGGMGPYSGVHLLKKIFDNTFAKTDEEHLDVILINSPSTIADRTEFIVGNTSENPAFSISEIILKLQETGAENIGIPCNTAHSSEIFDVVKAELRKRNLQVNLLNMIDETISFISKYHPNLNRIGILCTTGAFKTQIYPKALQARKLVAIEVSAEIQEKFIHPAIYDEDYGIKATLTPVHPQARKNLLHGISYLKSKGAQAVILGCSEIPMAVPEEKTENILLFDPVTFLARALIQKENPEKLKPL